MTQPMRFMAASLFVAAFAAPDTCGDVQQPHKTCAQKPFHSEKVSDVDECCALCAKKEKCVQWTLSAARAASYANYRHQADACHAYQLMVKRGIPAEQIILMMADDVADSSENPFKGKLFNRAGDNVPDVYGGCKIDYRGSVVTAKLFLSVITGDSSSVPNGGKVLKSGPNDHVFINFVDHGGVNIVAFPYGNALHSSELATALKTMTTKKMFNELVFYMEACESGSMFPGLASDTKILAVTAANAHESSWGYYCMPNDKVNGKDMHTCLGDLFSISWMEDMDVASSSETISEQIAKVTKRTNKSHVMTFGDKSFENEPISNFARSETMAAFATEMHDDGAIDSRDIALRMAYEVWARSPSNDEKDANWAAFRRILKAHDDDDTLFSNIVSKACGGVGAGCDDAIKKKRTQLMDNACHMDLVKAVHDHCPRREQYSESGWNDYNMKFSAILVNVCEAQEHLGKDAAALRQLVIAECEAASGMTSADQLLV